MSQVSQVKSSQHGLLTLLILLWMTIGMSMEIEPCQIRGKGFTKFTLIHRNLVNKNIPMPQRIEVFKCKSSSGQGIEKVRDISSTATGKSQKQEGCYYSRCTKRQKERKVHLCFIDGRLSPHDDGVRTKISKKKKKSSRAPC